MSKARGRHCAQRSVLPSSIRKLAARIMPGVLLGSAAAGSVVGLAGSGGPADAADAAPALPDHPALSEPHSADLDAVVAIHHARHHKTVTVAPGDTLSGLAASHCGSASRWENLYSANEKVVGSDPNLIKPGQKLKMWCHEHVIAQLTAAATPAHSSHAAPAHKPAVTVSGTINTSGMSAFESCVIQHESGGDDQIWNASGHWGAFQFSEQTWVAHGGNPADFGHAGFAEQQQIFFNTVAADGTSDWAPYDGC